MVKSTSYYVNISGYLIYEWLYKERKYISKYNSCYVNLFISRFLDFSQTNLEIYWGFVSEDSVKTHV